MTEVYRFSAGRSAAQALDIGGGKAVALGSISKRIKASEAEIAALNERINVLKVNEKPAQTDFSPCPSQLVDDAPLRAISCVTNINASTVLILIVLDRDEVFCLLGRTRASVIRSAHTFFFF